MSSAIQLQQPQVPYSETREYKNQWQNKFRKRFLKENGFSITANNRTGGLRRAVLDRDGWACVKCGMTDADHKAKWSRPITVDHKDKNRANNTMENLQTLCLPCHGRKDLIPRLRKPQVPVHKSSILKLYRKGKTYRFIAAKFNFSVAAVYNWIQFWTTGDMPRERYKR